MNESKRKLNETKLNSVREALLQRGELGQVRIINTLENAMIRREAKGLDSDEVISQAMLIGEQLGIHISRSTGEIIRIDTSKYEGHTPAPWAFKGPQGLDIGNGTHAVVSLYDDPRMRTGGEADMQLIKDAPLLLAEVKRLREGLRRLLNPYQHGLSNDKEPLPKWLGDAVRELMEEEE